MNLLLSEAEAAAAGGQASMLVMIVVYAVVFGGFYYFMISRPRKKEMAQRNALYSSMAVGDSVLTTSGFYGIIIDITEEDVIVEFGNNKNCRIPMKKAAIEQVEKPDAQ